MSFGTKSKGDDWTAALANLYEAALGDGKPAQPPTYVIFKDGSDYKARNGTTGIIDYEGTNAATVIQNAWDAMSAGKILLKAGTYSIGSTLTVPNIHTKIAGEAWMATKLDWTGGAGTIFDMQNVTGRFVAEDLHIDGNANNMDVFDYSGIGVALNNQHYNRLYIEQSGTGTAFKLGATLANNVQDSTFIDCVIDTAGVAYELWDHMCIVIRGGVGACTKGVMLGGASANVVQTSFYGTIFSSNVNDLYLDGNDLGLIFNGYGCWFENSSDSIFNASALASHAILSFFGCWLHSSGTYLFDFDKSSSSTSLTVQGCHLFPGNWTFRIPSVDHVHTLNIHPLAYKLTPTAYPGTIDGELDIAQYTTHRVIEHHTAGDTLLLEESGSVHTNLGAGGNIKLDLPQDAVAGITLEFVVMTAGQQLQVDAGAAGAIYINGAKQADDALIWADDEGESVKLVADGNGDWIALYTQGTWTVV